MVEAVSVAPSAKPRLPRGVRRVHNQESEAVLPLADADIVDLAYYIARFR